MNEKLPENEQISRLLKASKPGGELIPGFQNRVWRRIEMSAEHAQTGWLDQLASWLMRPRLALSGALALLLVGAILGSMDGFALSKQTSRDRYLATVAMNAQP